MPKTVKNTHTQKAWQTDKALLKLTLKNLDKAVCKVETPNFKTEVAGKILLKVIEDIKSAMHVCYEQL